MPATAQPPARTLSLPLLDRIAIASPCPVSWEDMTGDDVKRHCRDCRLDVYDIGAMTRPEAEAFLAARFAEDGVPKDGRLCARVWRRHDGTVITRDCPVGWASVRARARAGVARIAAILGLTVIASAIAESASASTPSISRTNPFPAVIDAVWWASAKIGLTTPRMRPPRVTITGGIVCVPPSLPVPPSQPSKSGNTGPADRTGGR